VRGLIEGGVDLFVVETMLDIQEARAALLAVKESCELPVLVSMTFDEGRRTLTGTDPVTALSHFRAWGLMQWAANCSPGLSRWWTIISMMKPFAKVPLMAKPNAGIPRFTNGVTAFDMSAKEFGLYAESFVKAGVHLLGGCCGTTPDTLKSCTGASPG
jgi:5-methyltetrahydrofolate--homocysteine methyltransferase